MNCGAQDIFKTITKDTEYCYTGAYNYCKALYYKQFTSLKAHDLQTAVDACPMGWRTKRNMKVMLTSCYKYAMENDYINKKLCSVYKTSSKREKAKKTHLPKTKERKYGSYTRVETRSRDIF